mmetsp:Transcript_26093/g.34259  ORF Transcript_26093/g.34259 Transcript_26093/m.34259 type:complete len:634 (+) Transcript_26093:47-1948(+)
MNKCLSRNWLFNSHLTLILILFIKFSLYITQCNGLHDANSFRRITAFRGGWKQEDRSQTKFVIVTGGVLSGIGKGVCASSVGVLLRMMGLRATAIKIDPYLNVDAGTMSPFEHGEVFVLDDGGETDLDLGNYERFMDVQLRNESNLTTGKIYQQVIENERRGDYLGKTVQVVPHITNAIQDWLIEVAKHPVDGSGKSPDVCVVELGGTLGDIESMPFVEALRQLQSKIGYKNCCFLHVSLVPLIGSPGEQKTKPTQHGVKQMRALGLAPDFIMCRGQQPLEEETQAKLAMFCQVPVQNVISVHDVSNIYYVPLLLKDQGFINSLAERLRLGPFKGVRFGDDPGIPKVQTSSLIKNKEFQRSWEKLAETFDSVTDEATIAVVGKYIGLSDTYLSIQKALIHAALATNQKLKINWVDSSGLLETTLESDPEKYAQSWEKIKDADGVLIPGGFGTRGLEGKIAAAKYARENKIPFLGICLGMQCAVIEYARAKLNRPNANSAEFVSNLSEKDQAVIFMPEGDKNIMGGTMRLGARTTILQPNTKAFELYKNQAQIEERHRHRYEVNPSIVPDMEKAGMKFVGRDTTGERMEIVEIEDHPYFLAAQYHPEYKSRPGKPSPLFFGLLEAVKATKNTDK